jgi:hypothetical protein
MILIDYSQIALASILTFQQDLKSGDSNKIVDLIRHVTLSSIKSYKKKYGKEYGEIVICCDGRKYWRREVFEFYKANRKKARDASDLDWKLIFDTLTQMREDIAKHFPYRVLHLDRAEADDIIAIMAKWTQDNGLVQQGLVEESQKVLILSSDHDFIQLQKYPNVSQWSPNVKKFIKVTDAERYTKYITHVVKAGDDGIPNILSPDNIFLQEGVRQKPVSAKRLAEFMELGFDACRNDEERRNWHRNVQLIDLDKIPADIEQDVVNAYLNTKVTGDKMSALKYLMDHRCRVLIEEIEDF